MRTFLVADQKEFFGLRISLRKFQMRAPNRPKVGPKLPNAKYHEGRSTRSSKYCVKMSDSNILSPNVWLCLLNVCNK